MAAGTSQYIKNIDKSEQVKDRAAFIEKLKSKGLVNKALEVLEMELASTKNRAWIAQWILEQSFGKAGSTYDNGIPQMMITWEKDTQKEVEMNSD